MEPQGMMADVCVRLLACESSAKRKMTSSRACARANAGKLVGTSLALLLHIITYKAGQA